MELLEDLHDLALEFKVGIRNPTWTIMRVGYRFEYLRPTVSVDRDCLSEVKQLRSRGVAMGFNLNPLQKAEIVNYAFNTPCYGNRKLNNAFRYGDTRKFATAYYFNTQRDCLTINKLCQNKKVLAIAKEFLGGEPLLLGTTLWWSFANTDVALDSPARRRWGQLFHYDLDGGATCKFFFYLTDVDKMSGPHVIIQNSARKKPLIFQIRRRGWTESALKKYYRAKDFLTITGSAGFGFIEDPFCFHRGIPPLTKDRLMLSLNYGLTNYSQQHDLRKLAK